MALYRLFTQSQLGNGHFIAVQSQVDGTIAKAGAFLSQGNSGVIHETCDNHARRRCNPKRGYFPVPPGDQMQDKGSVKGSPGASGYAPGHEMQKKGSVKGTEGASGYAPGRSTTGSKTDKDDATTKSK